MEANSDLVAASGHVLESIVLTADLAGQINISKPETRSVNLAGKAHGTLGDRMYKCHKSFLFSSINTITML